MPSRKTPAKKKPTRQKKTIKPVRERKDEPLWAKLMRSSGAPEECVTAALDQARLLGLGASRGRPCVKIDADSLAAIAMVCPRNEVIADVLGISRSTLQAKLASDETLRDALEHARAMRKVNLHAIQYAMAMGGSEKLAMWLGQQELGQQQRRALVGDPDAPVIVATVADIAKRAADRKAARERGNGHARPNGSGANGHDA